MTRAKGVVLLAFAAMAVLAPLALAVARWPQWWAWIASEQTPMTWLQSVVLVLAAMGSLLVGYLTGRLGGGRRETLPWLVLAAGFGSLALDERFAVHERLRDGILAPRGISVPFLPWVAPGDFLMMGVGLVGLALLPMVWRAIRVDALARTALIVGVVLSIIALGMDSIDPSTMSIATERLEQTLEECVELAAGLSYLAAVAMRLLGVIDVAIDEAVGRRTPAEPAAESTTGSTTESTSESTSMVTSATADSAPFDHSRVSGARR
ncbi:MULTISPECIES: hypothetical protein [unclassified Janibacter]|uniref:hypothetical protein n=1 Tax=unclassified Janibacter TaxID=2649294 RepID=UPI003D08640E